MVKCILLSCFLIWINSNLFCLEQGKTWPSIPIDTAAPLIINARDHQGQMVRSESGLLQLSTGLLNDYYYADSLNRTGYFYVETKIDPGLTSLQQRPSFNISIVLDRSGSMGEDREDKKPYSKIEFAKKAAKMIVDRLNDSDHISIVVYDNFINVIQKATPDTNKYIIRSRLDRVNPRGATDLWGGTEAGYRETFTFYDPGRVNRVLLLSDGEANVGITDPETIYRKVRAYRDSGISLSTFGVGLDYNERLMTGMAMNGSGNYYFIDSAGRTPALFENEWKSMVQVVAQNAELTIDLPKGVKVEETYPIHLTSKGERLSIRLQDLSVGDVQGILVKYSIQNRPQAPLNFMTSLRYVEVGSRTSHKLENINSLKAVKDKNAYLSHFNRQVIEKTILFSANNNLEEAMELVDKGDFNNVKYFLERNQVLLGSNHPYTRAAPDLQSVEKVNRTYFERLPTVPAMRKDSLQLFQKSNRAVLYHIIHKKEG